MVVTNVARWFTSRRKFARHLRELGYSEEAIEELLRRYDLWCKS